jgi:hypothetical protein
MPAALSSRLTARFVGLSPWLDDDSPPPLPRPSLRISGADVLSSSMTGGTNRSNPPLPSTLETACANPPPSPPPHTHTSAPLCPHLRVSGAGALSSCMSGGTNISLTMAGPGPQLVLSRRLSSCTTTRATAALHVSRLPTPH